MLMPKHVGSLCRLGDGKRSMVVRCRGIAVQLDEFPELFVGQSEVVLVFVEAPSDFGVDVGHEDV